MARILNCLIVLFVIWWTTEPAFGEPGPLMSAGAAKSPTDGASSTNVAASSEKGGELRRTRIGSVPSQSHGETVKCG